MKAFKAIYSHGHFIDLETKERLIPIQGEEYTISAKDSAFKTEKKIKGIEKGLDSKIKAYWALKKFGTGNFVRLLKAGEKLFFRVGNSKHVEGDEDREYIFVCILKEDLYLYKMNERKGDRPDDWRLAQCKCELEKCLLGGLTLTSNVESESLNSLFNYTVQDYFRGQRTGATNAINTFFIYNTDLKITFDGAKNRRYESLSELRKHFVLNRKQH